MCLYISLHPNVCLSRRYNLLEIAPVSFVSISHPAPTSDAPCYKFQKGEPLCVRALPLQVLNRKAAQVSR